MATQVELKLGLNLTVGSVPLALDAKVERLADGEVYTFDGCVREARVSFGDFLSFVGSQFQVSVQLPPELNLSATLDYLAGHVVCAKPNAGAGSTQMSVAGQFQLTAAGKTVVLEFYAGAATTNPAPPKGNPYVVGAAIATDLPFSKLPLIGQIPKFKDLTLTSLGFSYTNSDQPIDFQIPSVDSEPNPLYTRTDPNAKDAKSYSITSDGADHQLHLQRKGFCFTARLVDWASQQQIDSFALPMALPETTPSADPAPYSQSTTTPAASPVHWINIGKTFGPLEVQKIGLNYSGGRAAFGLSASFAVGGFSMGLEGLTVSFPMPLPGSPAGAGGVEFDLAGLTLDIQKGPLHIGGAFLKVSQDGVTRYLGEAVVQTAKFGFKAMGGYTPAGSGRPASFFLYANLQGPLGGPPFLFVTGLAGGFGIHNQLLLPTIDTLPGYILLPTNAPAQGDSASSTMQSVLPQLQSVFADRPGAYWFAAGIQFTSFEMIHAFALVTVAFGVDLQIAVLGTCSMTLPTGSPNPVAYLEIDLIASFTSSSGLLAVQGKLSPASYLFGGFCKLTGGFAFYTWFKGPHEGDFVVTLGGYHPAFNRPAHYPVVPRLAMSFKLGGFQVVGEAYFALTPGMLMAGQRMSATWSSGPVDAWLDAGFNFLISWAPFHYEADAYVSIGCSVDLGLFTVHAHVGANLQVWGPPFGGRAEVDLSVVSFTISFGASHNPPPPVGWAAFRDNFLPKDSGKPPVHAPRAFALHAPFDAGLPGDAPTTDESTNIIKAGAPLGLLQSDAFGFDWILDPDHFAIVTNSTIPANNGEWATASGSAPIAIPNSVASYNDVTKAPYWYLPADATTSSATEVWRPDLHIGPMQQNNVQSYHTVAVRMRAGGDARGRYSNPVTWVSVQPMLLNSSSALWDQYKARKDANDPALVENTLTGFQITPIPRRPAQVGNIPLLRLLFQQGNLTGYAFRTRQVDGRYTVQSSEDASHNLKMQISGARTQQITNQNYILSALADPWVAGQRNAILDDLRANGFATYASGDVTPTILATKKALVDWPMVKMIGAI